MDNPITLASLRRKVSAGHTLSHEESFWLIEAVSDLTAELALAQS